MCLGTRSPAARTPSLHSGAALLPAFLALTAGPAAAEPCKLGRAGELPVTMQGMQPLVHAAINGKDALFLADSGAFFSVLTRAAAHQFNLSMEPTSPNFSLRGVGGQAQAWVTTVQTLTLFKMNLPKVPFLVEGNDIGPGVVGALGQNVFQLGDVEYDLANGAINIVRTRGDCRKASLAYWANAKGLPYSVIDIEYSRAENPQTRGEAFVNGSKIRVLFDTGASTSGLSLDAARHAGVTPDSPGVTPGGTTQGIGRRQVRTWIAPIASFKIGDEEIRNTHLRIGDEVTGSDDMLLGADFFLSHHILVASSQGKIYFTYNGGPVFNLTTIDSLPPGAAVSASTGAAGAVEPGAAEGAAAATRPAREESLDAAGYARRGSASAARRDYERALADLTRAIELAPAEAGYRYQRGMAYRASGQADKALEDFGEAIRLRPSDVPALMARAELRAGRGDAAGLIGSDLDAADHAAAKEADIRLTLGNLYESIHNDAAAISQYDRWIDAHGREDVDMGRARNLRCRARALTGEGLDQALDDCNFAVRREPKEAAFLDSRGLVYLRQGRYDKAIADYDAALALNPKIAWSLYGRGLAKQHLGQGTAGQADIAAATTLFPRIADEAASHGIVP